MIHGWVKIEKFLNYLLVFLLPTQLALHFWPSFAFVFGMRVDYLSPSIYLTDLIFITVFVPWLRNNYQKFISFLKANSIAIFIFVLVAALNTYFSISVFASIYKWLKVIELVLFCLYVSERKDIFKQKTFLSVFYCSLLFFSLIAIVKFVLGRTIGWPFYLLGERSFSIFTPGIALVRLGGVNFMRAYSTFSHPNSLAGYLGIGLLILIFSFSKSTPLGKKFGLSVILIALGLTFSLSAFLGMIVCLIFFVLLKKNIVNRNNVLLIPLFFLIVSLSLPFISKGFVGNKIFLSDNINQRLELAFGAGNVISRNFTLGQGINTFIIGESRIRGLGFYLWLLQPVHNIFLLIFSETGIVGLLFLFWLLSRYFRKSFLMDDKVLFMSLVFILTTGLFDHYWLTLQQNMFLFAFVLSNSFKVKH